MRHALLVLVPAAALAAGTFTVAQAQEGSDAVGASLSPNTPKGGSKLTLSIDGTKLPAAQAGRAPAGFRLKTQRGFAFDPDAVTKACTARQAKDRACPDEAKIGGGEAVVTVASALFNGDVTADLTGYLGEKVRPGDRGAIVLDAFVPRFRLGFTITARVTDADAPFGLQIAADDLGLDALPAGFKATLKTLEATIGASRTEVVRTKKRKTVDGKRKTVTVKRTVRRSLIRNPPRCTPAGWASQVVLSFADGGPAQTVDVTVPCREKR